MPLDGFDHVAIPTKSPEAMMAFYGQLGFEVPDFEAWRASGVPFFSIHFGKQKINLHCPALWQDTAFELRGPSALPGCGDFCFVWSGSQEDLLGTLQGAGAQVVAGPVELEGARGRGVSVYTRDPDANLLEFIIYNP